jgi:cytochrome b6-f complex iron-sulfur subunit
MTLGRRKLLVIGSGAVCAHALGCGPDFPTLAADIPAGNAAAVAVGTLRPIGGQGVAIGRDSAGIYALTLICTHAGCDMSQGGSTVSAGGIQCNCHQSRFDAQGNVIRGPAGSPLAHLIVTADATGELTIHGDEPCPAGTRLGT